MRTLKNLFYLYRKASAVLKDRIVSFLPGKRRLQKDHSETVLGPMKIKLDVVKAKQILGLKSDINGQLMNGPIDSVLGFFNDQNGDLVIDVEEVFLSSSPKSLQEFDDQLTKVVCHEFWHVKQKEARGKIFFKIQKLIFFVLLLGWAYLLPLTTLLTAIFEPRLIIYVVGGLLDAYFILRYVLPLLAIISYLLSPAELGARRYAKKHYRDLEWAEVIKVSSASKEEMFEELLKRSFSLVAIRER